MSSNIFKDLYPTKPNIAWLIENDMFFHKCRSIDLDNLEMDSNYWVLLIVALCEIHANADLFGGINSESFKIKQKRYCASFKKLTKKLSL